MMKQLLIMLLICVLPVAGCRSTKTAVKENIRLGVAENVDKTEKETETVRKTDNVIKEVKVSVADKTVTVETVTDYSEPNTVTGEQYKTRETRTETRKDVDSQSEQSKRIISEQNSVIERLTTDNSELRTKLNASLSEKRKTTTRMPFWTYIAAIAIGAAGAIFIRKWLSGIFRF